MKIFDFAFLGLSVRYTSPDRNAIEHYQNYDSEVIPFGRRLKSHLFGENVVKVLFGANGTSIFGQYWHGLENFFYKINFARFFENKLSILLNSIISKNFC